MLIRSLICLFLMGLAPAFADEPSETASSSDEAEAAQPNTVEVRGERIGPEIDEDRAVTRTTRKTIEERQPRSTPDALNFSPGVYVQQTAHAQGSPYIRGRTGQQTLLLFDGLRLNHALFRKGPNQYLFTVDARTLAAIEVVRGSASVELGNDAIAGAVFLRPLEPALDPTRAGVVVRPKVMARLGSADGEYGGRLQLDAQFGRDFGLIAGVGARAVGQLEAGGYAFGDGRASGQACQDILSVPCFEDDGRTQRGTGFDELTSDMRAVYTFPRGRVTAAAYLYRQFDAPRTDQCPAPEAAIGECLVYDEQFRTHAYLKLEHSPSIAALKHYQMALSLQRQHQRYQLTRPDRNPNDSIDTTSVNGGRDAVNGLSTYFRGETQPATLGQELTLELRYGIDGSHEQVESRKWLQFAEPPTTLILSRGQYIEGSEYSQGGAYLAPAIRWRNLRLRAGGRAGFVQASSPGEEESATRAFEQTHTPVVYNAGLRWGDALALTVNVEQGVRPPNLDDLTARQSTGQGYQLDNPDLVPERALTIEAGVRARYQVVDAEVLLFKQYLTDAIERRLLSPEDCRLSAGFVDQACRANRAPLQLVNLPGEATIHGLESRLSIKPVPSLTVTGTLSYTFGEGPNPSGEPGPPIPLSRIPPLNGTGEVTWRDPSSGLYLGMATRWATEQTRLSVGDVSDARIPKGGTPGYAIYDARAGLRIARRFSMSFVFENLTDAAYRTHGSGVLGAGRSIVLSLEYTPSEVAWDDTPAP